MSARTVEGAERLIAQARLHYGNKLNRGNTISAPPEPRMVRLQKRVCEYFDISMDQLLSDQKARMISRPRQIAMYLAAKMMRLSLPEIGHRFGGRDHTTVLHAIRAVEQRIGDDDDTKLAVEELSFVLADILADNGRLRLVVSVDAINAMQISATRRLGLVFAQIEAEARRDPLALLEVLQEALGRLPEDGE